MNFIAVCKLFKTFFKTLKSNVEKLKLKLIKSIKVLKIKIKSINQKLKQSPNETTEEVLGKTQTVLQLKQPPNLFRLISMKRKNPRFSQGLFNCHDKNFKLCALYIKLCACFKISDNAIWYIRSHMSL